MVPTVVSAACQVQSSSKTDESYIRSPVSQIMNSIVIVSPGETGACDVSQPVIPPPESVGPFEQWIPKS